MTIPFDSLVEPRAAFTAADGSTELAELRGPEGGRMLSHVHLPGPGSRPGPRGAVVICSPLLGEFMRNYRREVLVARRLAQAGFAVERFHYRFSGNSDGEDEDLTFDSMRRDALDAVGHIRERAPDGPLFLLGARFGALVAGSAAAEHADAGLVVWEPMLDAGRYFREAFRSRLVKDRRDGQAEPVTSRELDDHLRSGQPVEVPGYRIFPALHRTAVDRKLETELGSAPRPVLAVQVGPTGMVRAELERQVERWRTAGLRVDVTAVRGEESWWLVDERWHDEAQRPMTKELLALTTSWVDERTTEDETR
jgi:alpha/beta superfamily hydrolase